MNSEKLAHFLMVGQTAGRVVSSQDQIVPSESIMISKSLDLAMLMPQECKDAIHAATAYKLFFAFEAFLRDLIRDALSEDSPQNWWDTKVPQNIKDEVTESVDTEETKAWMALGARDKIELTTYGQLLAIIDSRWKQEFEAIVRDKSLIQEARHLTHLRNAICHMTDIPEEEVDRIRQTLRDWFRMVTP